MGEKETWNEASAKKGEEKGGRDSEQRLAGEAQSLPGPAGGGGAGAAKASNLNLSKSNIAASGGEIAIGEEGHQRYAGAQFGGGGMSPMRDASDEEPATGAIAGAGITEPDIDLNADERAAGGGSGEAKAKHDTVKNSIQNIR